LSGSAARLAGRPLRQDLQAQQQTESREEMIADRQQTQIGRKQTAADRPGLAGWLIARMTERLRGARRSQPRLALVERIALAPRQSLALVEAEGRRFLVASSPDGAPAFYPLDAARGPAAAGNRPRARASW
jgi:hypothetical protein